MSADILTPIMDLDIATAGSQPCGKDLRDCDNSYCKRYNRCEEASKPPRKEAPGEIMFVNELQGSLLEITARGCTRDPESCPRTYCQTTGNCQELTQPKPSATEDIAIEDIKDSHATCTFPRTSQCRVSVNCEPLGCAYKDSRGEAQTEQITEFGSITVEPIDTDMKRCGEDPSECPFPECRKSGTCQQ